MAPGRVYRDYYSETDLYPADSSRARSVKSPVRGASSAEITSAAAIHERDELADIANDDGAEDNAPSAYDEDVTPWETTPYEDSESFYQLPRPSDRAGQAPNDSATALPSIPLDSNKHRRISRISQPAPSFSRAQSSSSIPSRAPSRPLKVASPTAAEERQDGGDKPAVPAHPHSIENMPEFFSPAIFHTVLNNPTIGHQLLKFGQTRLCGESIEFLARVSRYHALLQEVSKTISDIHSDFLVDGAPSQINVPQHVLVKVNSEVKSSLAYNMPRLEAIFGRAQNDIEQLVYGDVYPGFVRHQMSMSAAKALGGNRSKYAGLGDCFVLTDPAKADNPIVFASDGFVKVTGYPRTEIIPRNCRFLQGSSTDRAAVKRIKEAVKNQEESVELLLNRRKDGEPFWNLLYTTPLFDANGKLVFFLGGQINCSTTVHSTSDVLRILAQSEEGDNKTPAERAAVSQQKSKSRSRGLFRSNSRSNIQPGVPGMEDNLLGKLESMPLQGQFKTFYGAYSNFIIVNYSTYLIAFISTGIVDMLFPIKAKQKTDHAMAAGTDIFKFLANHGTGSLSWDFKSAVKAALKSGQAISLDLKLCAKPYMGFEKFICHWTPLKDDRGAVTWVVLTLGSEQRAGGKMG